MAKLLQYCGDVRHLSLSKDTRLNIEQMTKVLQHMEHLSVLKIRLSVGISSLFQLTNAPINVLPHLPPCGKRRG